MTRLELNPARLLGEPFKRYKARRAAVNRAIDAHLRGRLAHVSSPPAVLPLLGVDPQADCAILAGQFRDVKMVFSPLLAPAWPHGPRVARVVPKQIRIGRTKGTAFCHGNRAELRRETLAASRAARQ